MSLHHYQNCPSSFGFFCFFLANLHLLLKKTLNYYFEIILLILFEYLIKVVKTKNCYFLNSVIIAFGGTFEAARLNDVTKSR